MRTPASSILIDTRAGPAKDLRRHRRWIGRRRRHGRMGTDVAGPQRAPRRSGQEGQHHRGAALDGVAVRPSAAWPDVAEIPRAVAERIQHPQPPVRPGLDVRESLLLRAGLGRVRLFEDARRGREGPPVFRHEVRVGSRTRASAARRTSGAVSRCDCRTTTSRASRTMGTARTGRSATRTSRRTTTRWTCCSASRASRRTCRSCRTASSSAPTS